MKAEHRKELETNVLADRMGRFVQRIKERPQRRTTLYVVLGLALLVGVFVFYRVRQGAANDRSERWVMFEDGIAPFIEELWRNQGDTNPGKAAMLEFAWFQTWDNGLRGLAIDPSTALGNLGNMGQPLYRKIAEECADDPVWEPEAMYGQAVIEESLAIRSRERSEHLDKALSLYQELAKKHKNSARGKDAAKRAEVLEKNRTQIGNFYRDLQDRLGIPEEDVEEPKLKRKKK